MGERCSPGIVKKSDKRLIKKVEPYLVVKRASESGLFKEPCLVVSWMIFARAHTASIALVSLQLSVSGKMPSVR